MSEQPYRVLPLAARCVAGAFVVAALAVSTTTCKRSPAPVATTGSVEGTVVLEGERPEQRSIKVAGCPTWEKMWADERPPDPAWTVHATGGLPNVFVWAAKGPHLGKDYSADLGETQVLSIIGHYFHPRVFGVTVDQEVKIANEDKSLFTIPLSFADGSERLIEVPGGRSHPFSFPVPEQALSIKPKRHSWLQAWAFVLEHPFHTVTDERGRFAIQDLPAGDYTFHAWHETFGEVEFKATVTGGEVVSKNVSMKQGD